MDTAALALIGGWPTFAKLKIDYLTFRGVCERENWGPVLGFLKINSYSIFFNAESALAGIAAVVPVGSAPPPTHRPRKLFLLPRTLPRRFWLLC